MQKFATYVVSCVSEERAVAMKKKFSDEGFKVKEGPYGDKKEILVGAKAASEMEVYKKIEGLEFFSTRNIDFVLLESVRKN